MRLRATTIFLLILPLVLAGCQGWLREPLGMDDKPDPPDPAAITVDCPACTDSENGKFAGPIPLEVGFSVVNYESQRSYTWEFGDDGAASTRPDTRHTFDEVGFYTVKLTVETEEETHTNSVLIRAEHPDEPQEPEHISGAENSLIETTLLAKRNNFDDTQLQVRLLVTAKRELQSCSMQIFARIGGKESISGEEWQHRWPQGEHPVSEGEQLDYRGQASVPNDEPIYVSGYLHCAEPGWGAEGAELELPELEVE